MDPKKFKECAAEQGAFQGVGQLDCLTNEAGRQSSWLTLIPLPVRYQAIESQGFKQKLKLSFNCLSDIIVFPTIIIGVRVE